MSTTPQSKTGLGMSPLLQTSSTPAPPPKRPLRRPVRSHDFPERSDVQTSEPEVGETVAPATAPAKKKKARPKRDRCTIYLERAVNKRLKTIAFKKGSERSDIVNAAVKQYLEKEAA